MAAVYFGLMIILFKDDFKHKAARYIFIALCALAGLLVSYTRIYLGAHWLSDVLAGIALGLFIIAAVVLALKKGPMPTKQKL
jgi:undecaprenyl-diphosphatase